MKSNWNFSVISRYQTVLKNILWIFVFMFGILLIFDIVLIFTASHWEISLILFLFCLFIPLSAIILYKSITHQLSHRDRILLIEWVVSYIGLIIGIIPIVLALYLNLKWPCPFEYELQTISMQWTKENLILPTAIFLLVTWVYWTMVVLLYKESHTLYECLNKKKDIYGK